MAVSFTFDGSIPVAALETEWGNWGLQAELPTVELESSWQANWTFEGTVPEVTLSSSWRKRWAFQGAIPEVALNSKWRPTWTFEGTIPAITLDSATASKWRFDGKLSVATLVSDAIPVISWALEAELPIIQVNASYYVFSIGDGGGGADEPSATALCINPMNAAHSEYTNFAFNSFCEFNGQYLGLDSDVGIYVLAGEDDAGTPIDSSLRFGAVDEETSKLKRVDSAYLNLRHDGNVRVLMKYDEMEEDISEVDFDPGVDPIGIHTRRAKFSRGIRGRNLQLGIENVSGADFEITEIKVVTVPLSRS